MERIFNKILLTQGQKNPHNGWERISVDELIWEFGEDSDSTQNLLWQQWDRDMHQPFSYGESMDGKDGTGDRGPSKR